MEDQARGPAEDRGRLLTGPVYQTSRHGGGPEEELPPRQLLPAPPQEWELPRRETDYGPVTDKKHRLRRYAGSFIRHPWGQGTTVVVAAAVLGAGVWIHAPETVPSTNSCDDTTHELVQIGFANQGFLPSKKDYIRDNLGLGMKDNDRTATDVSRTLSDQQHRGYDISATRLILSNPKLLGENRRATNKKLAQHGAFCLYIPKPVYAGYAETTGTQTPDQLASYNSLSAAALRGLNPDIDLSGNKVVPAGEVLRVSGTTTRSYVWRDSMGLKIKKMAGGDPNLTREIVMTNMATIANLETDGDATVSLEHGYYPPLETSWMRKHGITAAEIAAAYRENTSMVRAPQVTKPKK